MVDFNVNGKSALVTGGTRGIGYDIAEYFVLNGIETLIITSRKADACQKAKASLEQVAQANGKTVKIIAEACDIANDNQLRAYAESISKQVPKLDILIANAGTSFGAKFDKHSPDAIRKVLDLNVTAVFHCIQLFAPLLEKAGTAEDPARVVITSSFAAFVATDFGGTYGYMASKIGIAHIGKNLALTLADRNINVNSIAPGFFPTKMTKFLIETKKDDMNYGNPRQRLGQKSDLQNAVLWLCSKSSNYVNGIVLPVDGGLHLIGTPRL